MHYEWATSCASLWNGRCCVLFPTCIQDSLYGPRMMMGVVEDVPGSTSSILKCLDMHVNMTHRSLVYILQPVPTSNHAGVGQTN